MTRRGPRRRRSGSDSSADDPVVVFRSGQLHEADLVADELGRAGVPHYRRVESVTGLTFAMPVAPAPGLGAAWLILVSRSSASRARRLISRLPVANDDSPGTWGFRPRPEVKRFYKQYGWLLVVGLALVFLWDLFQLLRS